MHRGILAIILSFVAILGCAGSIKPLPPAPPPTAVAAPAETIKIDASDEHVRVRDDNTPATASKRCSTEDMLYTGMPIAVFRAVRVAKFCFLVRNNLLPCFTDENACENKRDLSAEAAPIPCQPAEFFLEKKESGEPGADSFRPSP